MTGTIIFLNGISNSGKTSIVKALQNQLQDPYLDRTLGQARAQFDVIQKYTCYDLEANTSTLTPEECAQKSSSD